MGRGDRRTAKGKRFKGSFGISRPHKAKKSSAAAAEKTPKAPAKKAAKKKATKE